MVKVFFLGIALSLHAINTDLLLFRDAYVHIDDPLANSSMNFIVPAKTVKDIALKMWTNECGKSDEDKLNNLIHWNKQEDFASVGIMHFTWSRDTNPGIQNQFPLLRTYINEQSNVILPEVLRGVCPWHSRDDLMQNLQTETVTSLRHYLIDTIPLQATFVIEERLKDVLPKLYQLCLPDQKEHVREQFYYLLNTKNGLFALVDTLNLSGIKGLYNALLVMNGIDTSKKTLQEFVHARIHRFHYLVDQTPSLKIYLQGWINRVNRYLD